MASDDVAELDAALGDASVEAADAASDASSGDAAADADAGRECGVKVYVDTDLDGVGAGEPIKDGCLSEGFARKGGDCQPDNPAVYPGAEEECNGADDDCDELLDEGATVFLYTDADGDGHGDKNDLGEPVCPGQASAGKVLSNDDCDDQCEHCSPEVATETMCDGKDDDCDGEVDDSVQKTWFLDCDRDGYLPAQKEFEVGCSAPELPERCAGGAWILEADVLGSQADCAPDDANRSPGNREVCDHVDNDCNGLVDEKDGVADGLRVTYGLDCDGDFYLKSSHKIQKLCPSDPKPDPVCGKPVPGMDLKPQWLSPDQVKDGEDCADTFAKAYPGSTYSSDTSVPGLGRDDFDYNCDGVAKPVVRKCQLIEGACLLNFSRVVCHKGNSADLCGVDVPALHCSCSPINNQCTQITRDTRLVCR